jgi:hypothetical protein
MATMTLADLIKDKAAQTDSTKADIIQLLYNIT